MSSENEDLVREAIMPLLVSKDAKIQLETWRCLGPEAAKRRNEALILKTLETATGALRVRVLRIGLWSSYSAVPKPCIKLAMMDLRGSDRAKRDAAFLAIAEELSRFPLQAEAEGGQVLVTLALHYLGSNDPEFVFATLKVLEETPTSSFSGRKHELSNAIAPLLAHPDPFVRNRLTVLLAFHLSSYPQGKKMLTTLCKDEDTAVRAAAEAALK